MLTKNSFKQTSTSFLDISKVKKVIAVFLGVFFSFIVYLFFQLFRKLIIVFDALLNDYELFMVSSKTNQFYNFLFAFIAVFFAFTTVFIYLTDIPNKFLSKYNYKKKAIITQQRLTNWYFLSWFSRIGFLVGLLALGYNGVNLYSEGKHILILFIIVFLGHIWLSVRFFIHKSKLLWFFSVILITLFCSFGLSQLNILNDELIYKSILSKNVLYKHDVHVVNSKVSTEIVHRSLILDIIISNKKDNETLIVDGTEIEKKDFEKTVFKYRSRISEAEIPFIQYVLYVDKNEEIKFIKEIKQRLIKIGGRKLYFATKINPKKPFYYKSNKGLGILLQVYIPFNETNGSKEISLKIEKNGLYFFNGKHLNKDNLAKEIKTIFQQKGVKSIRLFLNKNTSFYNYFQVLESSKKAIIELRNEYSQKGYALDYLELTRPQKQFIRKKIPWHIIDDYK